MDPTDNDAAHVWLSYAEAAAALGISARAVEGRAYRAGWAKQPGNDGTIRLAVPRNALGTPRHGAAGGNAPPRGSTSGQGHGSTDAPMVQVLVEELKASHAQAMADRQRDLESLRGQLADTSKAQSHAEGEAVALREALAHERAQVAVERQRAEDLQVERDQARNAAATAEGEAKALRVALARDARWLEQAEFERKRAETQRDAAQNAREATQAELASWTAGGPLTRAWRAFVNRRGG